MISTAWAATASWRRRPSAAAMSSSTGLPMADVDATHVWVLLIFAVVSRDRGCGGHHRRRRDHPAGAGPAAPGCRKPPAEVVDLPLDRGEVALPVRVREVGRQPPHRGWSARVGAEPNARPHRGRIVRRGRPARPGYASSSPTPATNCARHWPRSAAIPNWRNANETTAR